jgi:glycosyltransferase involved in cell wall biosynthesis
MTDVSVVIPTRDRAAWLAEAVESVLVQHGPGCEVIVVDDGSEDGTGEMVKRRWGRDVRYLVQPPSGVSAARNRGAREACGTWLAFLDSDDLWQPGKLAAQRAFHDAHPSVPVSQTEEIWIRRGVRVNPCRHHQQPEGDIFEASLERCLVSPSAVMLRRDLFLAVGGFDPTLAVCEDYDLWLRLALRVPFGLVRLPLTVKRGGHEDQLSRRYWGMDRHRVASLIGLLCREQLDASREAAVRRTIGRKCRILAAGAQRRGRTEEAQRYADLATCFGLCADDRETRPDRGLRLAEVAGREMRALDQ